MQYKIGTVAASEYIVLVELWEASVRATHHFLREEDILYFKPLILHEYLKAVDLTCVRDEKNKIAGFSGIANGKIEMLFIDPAYRGQGIGKRLLQHALQEQKVKQVDVNEQNAQAVGFYQHMGFRVVGRSDLDGLGKPYPILHLERT